MIRKSWLFVLPLVASILWVGAAPSQAAAPSWSITGVNSFGCNDSDWDLAINRTGFDSNAYTWHTQVISDGKVYMNEGFEQTFSNSPSSWGLYSDFSYDAVPNPGTYPMTAGKPMTVRITAERPKGTIVSSWTMVAASCNDSALTFNGADFDGDFVKDSADACPHLSGTAYQGCPERARTLTLKAKYGPKRLVGKLSAPGYPLLYAGRKVTIWKVRPGPDKKIATKTVGSLGKFKVRVGKGKYYVKSKAVVVPTAGYAAADISTRVKVH